MAYKEERLANAIAYIARMHRQISGKYAYQTYMYKYISLVDFAELEECGHPMFDITYVALRNGPVPECLYDKREELIEEQPYKNLFLVNKDDDGHIYYDSENCEEPDLDFFSDYELELIENTVEKYAHEGMKVNELEEATHRKIKAWETSWSRRGDSQQRVPIDPLFTFVGIKDKGERDLRPEEEMALLHYGVGNDTRCSC